MSVLAKRRNRLLDSAGLLKEALGDGGFADFGKQTAIVGRMTVRSRRFGLMSGLADEVPVRPLVEAAELDLPDDLYHRMTEATAGAEA